MVDPVLFHLRKEHISAPFNRTYEVDGQAKWGIEVTATLPIVLTGVTTHGERINVHENKIEEMEQNFRRLHTHQENKDRIVTELRRSCEDLKVPIYTIAVLPGYPADPTPRPTPPPTEFTFAP